MIFINHFGSSQAAIDYHGHLSRGDYFSQDAPDAPVIDGQLAERLGLEGRSADRDTYSALCRNEHPDTGEPITPRTREDRRSMTDFTFDVPKSVSLVALADSRVESAVNDSVRETMREIEKAAAARVRKGGKDENRTTGEMLWITWAHETGRPLDDGTVDPQKHRHVTVMNMTWDAEESQYKAVQLGDIVRDKGYYQAAYHARLGAKLSGLGYGIERDGNSFKVAGIGKDLTEKFSRRHAVIDEKAKEIGTDDPAKRAKIAKSTRKKKGDEQSTPELVKEWLARMTPEERQSLKGARHGETEQRDAKEAVGYAIDHIFQKESSISEAKLKGEALRYAVGSVTPEEVDKAVYERKDLLHVTKDGERKVTTREMLNLEIEMLAYARNGNGKHKPLGEASHHIPETLSAEQGGAVSRMLNSRDAVIGFRGGAGTGKTTTLAAAVKGIERDGKGTQVIGAAVSTTAVNELKDVGISDSYTLAAVLNSKALQAKLKGKVLLLDEASQISTRDMAAVFRIAKEQKARVILSGDYRQHGSVEAGDAFRLLASEAGVRFAELKEIRRQTEPTYKKAVEHIEKGTRAGVQKGYDLLDKQGRIVESSGEDRHRALVADYLDTISETKKVKDAKTGVWRTEAKTGLIVTPTNAEASRITEELRETLKRRGDIGDEDRIFKVRSSTGWTDAEKGDHRNYEKGMVVQFFQNVGKVKKSTVGVVSGKDTSGRVRLLIQDGEKIALPMDRAKHFEVYRVNDLSVAKGDRIRITQNGKLLKDSGREKRVSNGDISTVTGFHEDGAIRLSDGTILPPTYGNFKHGYVDTSYGSQGKTVDRVHIAAGSSSVLAVNAQQWYVSVSRGRESATVYVDDKAAMREAITRKGERLAAVDLVKGTHHENKNTGWRERVKEMLERSRLVRYWKRNDGQEQVRRHAYGR